MKIQTVTLIGLGAIGSFFAPKLCEYLGDRHFHVLAQGERRRKIESGITINGKTWFFPVASPDEKADPADLVIVAVKDTGFDQAMADIAGQMGPHTQILCVLNGVDSERKAAAVYGWDHVLYSYMRVSIEMKGSSVDYLPDTGSIHFGEAANDTLTERTAAVKSLFDACGIRSEIDPDMIRGIWLKFMTNVGNNLTCALLGIPFGALAVSEHANEIRNRAMREVVAVARRMGVNLSQADIPEQARSLDRVPFHNKPSTLQDLENGRRTEIGMFAGRVVEMGKQLGIDTPVNWLFDHAIRVYEEKNRGKFE